MFNSERFLSYLPVLFITFIYEYAGSLLVGGRKAGAMMSDDF